MSNNTPHTNGEGAHASPYNVISLAFEADTNAYAALPALKDLDTQGSTMSSTASRSSASSRRR